MLESYKEAKGEKNLREFQISRQQNILLYINSKTKRKKKTINRLPLSTVKNKKKMGVQIINIIDEKLYISNWF